MRFYGLSEQKVRSVIGRPKRKEEGVVENTIAVMQPVAPKMVNGKEVWKQEVWVMFQKNKKQTGKNKKLSLDTKCKIISAWRYPGLSPQKNPIPEEILRELLEVS